MATTAGGGLFVLPPSARSGVPGAHSTMREVALWEHCLFWGMCLCWLEGGGGETVAVFDASGNEGWGRM